MVNHSVTEFSKVHHSTLSHGYNPSTTNNCYNNTGIWYNWYTGITILVSVHDSTMIHICSTSTQQRLWNLWKILKKYLSEVCKWFNCSPTL